MFKKRNVAIFSIIFAVLALATTLSNFAVTSAQQNQTISQAAGGSNTTSSGTKASIVSGASTMTDKAFSPNPINVKVGGTVTWTNDDTMFHTVTSGTGI